LVGLLKSISTPIVWILAFLIFGLILTGKLRKKPRLNVGWYFLVFATCILCLLSIKPISNILVYSLECQYQSPSQEVLAEVDIVVVLGGGVMSSGAFRKSGSPEASGATYSRVFNGVKIFRQSGAKVLVLSGAGVQRDGETNADVMKDIAIALGIPENKIITEGESHNTMEHAVEIAKLFPPEERMRIGVVTSALHMKRAVFAFYRKFPQNSIIPIPVGYIYLPPDWSIDSFISSAEAFSASSYAIHEWVGMLWYGVRY
jgi:uncharacterized SAM-binding protein YcdF (DUF218 family)